MLGKLTNREITDLNHRGQSLLPCANPSPTYVLQFFEDTISIRCPNFLKAKQQPIEEELKEGLFVRKSTAMSATFPSTRQPNESENTTQTDEADATAVSQIRAIVPPVQKDVTLQETGKDDVTLHETGKDDEEHEEAVVPSTHQQSSVKQEEPGDDGDDDDDDDGGVRVVEVESVAAGQLSDSLGAVEPQAPQLLGRRSRSSLRAPDDESILERLFDPDRKQKPALWTHIKLVAPGPVPPPGQLKWHSKDAVAAYCLVCQKQFTYTKGTSKTVSRHMVAHHGLIDTSGVFADDHQQHLAQPGVPTTKATYSKNLRN